MASNAPCTACFRALRQRTPLAPRNLFRPLSLSAPQNASVKPTPSHSPSPLSFASPSTPLNDTPAQETSAPSATENSPAPGYKPSPEEPSTRTLAQRLAEQARKHNRSGTETYVAYGVTEMLFKECARQADYTIPQVLAGQEAPRLESGEDLGVPAQDAAQGKWWYGELELTPTFSSWSQITMLHMWLLTTRFRLLPSTAIAQPWHQHLLDHFFFAAEDRMVRLHNISAKSIRNKYLKDLFIQWRGVTAAYDEGLVKGDAALAAALWRNVWKAAVETEPVRLAMAVAFVRREVARLERLPDAKVFASPEFTFSNPAGLRELVLKQTPGMKKLE